MAEEIRRALIKVAVNEIKEVSATEKAEEEANLRRAVKQFITSPQNSENFGTMVSGFISYAESVKKRGKKKDPTPSKLTGEVPGIQVKQQPSTANKAALDKLTGKTSKDATVVKKLFADGSPKGIRAAISQHLTDNKDEINNAMKEASDATKDPVFQEKAKELGITQEGIDTISNLLKTDITTLAKDTESENAVTASKNMSRIQMNKLNDPFGSFKSKINVSGVVKKGDPIAPGSLKAKQITEKTGFDFSKIGERNPFGTLGIDFGNVMGNVAAVSSNLPVQKDLGVEIPAKTIITPGVSQSDIDNVKLPGDTQEVAKAKAEEIAKAQTAEEQQKVPPLVKADGSTNVSEVVEETEKVKAKPTTPVVDLNKTTNRISPDGFLYGQTATSWKELKTMAKTSTRLINNINFTWTGVATDRQYASAEEYNKKIIAVKSKMDNLKNLPIEKRASWGHFFIKKNGEVECILPIDKYGIYDHIGDKGITDEANTILKEGLTIVLDAGHEVPHSETTDTTYGPKSITPEQQKTIAKMVKALSYLFAASVPYSWDEVTGNPALGIGLDIQAIWDEHSRTPRIGAFKQKIDRSRTTRATQ